MGESILTWPYLASDSRMRWNGIDVVAQLRPWSLQAASMSPHIVAQFLDDVPPREQRPLVTLALVNGCVSTPNPVSLADTLRCTPGSPT